MKEQKGFAVRENRAQALDKILPRALPEHRRVDQSVGVRSDGPAYTSCNSNDKYFSIIPQMGGAAISGCDQESTFAIPAPIDLSLEGARKMGAGADDIWPFAQATNTLNTCGLIDFTNFKVIRGIAGTYVLIVWGEDNPRIDPSLNANQYIQTPDYRDIEVTGCLEDLVPRRDFH